MLMRCRVVDNLGPEGGEHIHQASAVPYRTDQDLQMKLRILFLEFKLYCVGIVLVDIKDDQAGRVMRGDLTAEFTAYTSSAACNQNGFAVDKLEHLPKIGFDRFASEKVLNGYILHICHIDLSRNQLRNTGQ